ncbi:deoxyribodipyrimidine photo-lyase [candidate division KSB1 bacterium]|nr:deoxyribodipyrimidine photo-lyase [candidate division KSB1 bacterium]
MIQPERIVELNNQSPRNGKYILCWMQASQRAEYNHALEYAIQIANQRHKPVVVMFGITDGFPEANERHYTFMLEGLQETQQTLNERGIPLVIRYQSPELAAVELSRDADLLVTDRGYLRIQRQWRKYVSEQVNIPVLQVESDVIVPIESASNKEEYAAATLRPKITKLLQQYLVDVKLEQPHYQNNLLTFNSFSIDDVNSALANLKIDRTVARVSKFKGGGTAARRWLDLFIESKLEHYADLRNDPANDFGSHLSPYLHFGQISPLEIALRVLEAHSTGEADFLEELIVRRELSMNYVYFNERYDSYQSLSAWAQQTLADHVIDNRQYIYSEQQFEQAATYDPYWNAAQMEMVKTGKIHNYMRMYWGKKILEWTRHPEEAFEIALRLNNKYELDGRDPNGFTGVAWCFGKHDRAWFERPIFGKVRYMNANGLRRKFDIDRYVKRVETL